MKVPSATKKTAALLRDLDAIGEGSVPLLPTESEDMWHANNLIFSGDVLRAHAIRKIVTESGTGSTSSSRVHTELTIRVTTTFYDPVSSSLRVTGVVVVPNPYVAKGQYHTLDLELQRPFVLWKKNGWDSVARQELNEALREDKEGALAAMVMGEGKANICLITDYQTLVKQRVTGSLPKKMAGSTDLDTGTLKFFNKTLATLTRTLDFSTPRVLLLAGPGYAAQNFKQFLTDEAVRTGDKMLRNMARDAIVVHASSSNVHALNEVIKSAEVGALVKNTRFRDTARLLDAMLERLRHDDGRVAYGARPVTKAIQEGAVGRGGGVLLVNNSLFRSQNTATRRRYVALVDKAKADGGEVHLISSDHETGQRLDNLGGVAAMLTYPMFDLDEEYDKEEEAERNESEPEGDATGTTII